MSELKHSPLPWAVSEDHPGKGHPFGIKADDGMYVADVIGNVAPFKSEVEDAVISRANAEYIVTAANAHPDLLARIEELEGVIDGFRKAVGKDYRDDCDCLFCKELRKFDAARATLSKEGGVK